MVNSDIFSEIQKEAAYNDRLDKEAQERIKRSEDVRKLDKKAIEIERRKM